jgi:hypothetical protein
MSNFLDPIKSAFREALDESSRKAEDQRIVQAFRNGVAVGIAIGASVVSLAWAVGVLSA